MVQIYYWYIPQILSLLSSNGEVKMSPFCCLFCLLRFSLGLVQYTHLGRIFSGAPEGYLLRRGDRRLRLECCLPVE